MSILLETPVDGAQSQKRAKDFPVFPPELEREIFLLTARTYRGVSTRLMLVASRVRAWMEPFVYETVLLRGPSHAIRFLGALKNYHSPEFAQSHVKALCISPSIPLTLANQLLITCSGLESLALWISPQSNATELVKRLSSIPLTYLSVNIASILPLSYLKPVLQNHPAFINLTHLDIVNNWVLWTSSLGIEYLPLLTHVAFRFWSRGSVSSALSKILRECPKLQALILLADPAVLPGAREYLEKQGVCDIRVVVLRHVRDADEWESMKRDCMTMWQRADIVVRWRRLNQGWWRVFGVLEPNQPFTADPFDFPPGFVFGSAEWDTSNSNSCL